MARSREARPADIEDLRSRLDEAESTIDAIRSGDVDAVVVQGPDGDQVYTLASADRPYRLFFEQMEEGAITLNADGVILASNQRFAAMVGRPVSDLVSRPLKELVHRCDVERVESFLRQRGRQDVRLLTSDGTFVATGFSAREMIVDDLAMLCVVVVDLTARRRAEEADRAVRNQARALVAAQAATFSWDPERGVFEGDENLPKLLGVDADVVSLNGEGGTAGERDAVALLRREIARLADADRALDTELCLEHGTAGERWIQIKAKVFPSDDGGRLVAGAVVDVTKERRLQAEREAALAALRRSDEALREANDRKDEFLAMLGHELRNPLSPIKNAVFILQKSGPADPTLDRARAIIDRQVDHMTRLIDDLLDVSRITQGKIALQRSAVTLSEIVEQAIEITRPLIERRGLGLRVSLECGSDRIECDRARIVQIFENLLTNAAKFTEPGGEIEVRATAGDRELAVTVKDTGIGISGEVAPKVFDLFVQETRSLDRAQGGLGVGLTLVRRIAELHGGRAEVHSDGLGHGSEFTVWLPRAPRAVVEPGTGAAGTDAAARSENGAVPGSTSVAADAAARDRAPLRVLIAEDNADSAESFRTLIELEGHDVRVVYDGRDIQRAALDFRPHVLFLDIGLPGIDGYEAARRLRSDARLADSLLVAVSGYGRDEDKDAARHAGFRYHLTKPVDFGTIRRLLADARTGVAASESVVH